MLTFIALTIYAAEVAIVGLILWFVVEFLPMPTNAKRVTQLLIALVCILSVLLTTINDTPPQRITAPNPSTPSNPSSILR